MALPSTIYNVDVDLTDLDRQVYESLSVRLAQHPSESPESLVTRLIAYCLEYREGIGFSAGVSTPDEPALAIRDLTGTMQTWIDVGVPDPARLHKASKAVPRVVVYVHKDPGQLLRRLEGARIHRAEALELYAVDRDLVAALVGRLERRMAIGLTVADGHLTVATADGLLEGAVTRVSSSGPDASRS